MNYLVSYKYTPQMFVIQKPKNQFLSDFFEKHFNDFLNGFIGLFISPVFAKSGRQQYMQLNFDLDSKFAGLNTVVKDCINISKKLNINFNVVTTKSGLHIISRSAFFIDKPIVDVNHDLQTILSEFKSIDWKGSVRSTPFGALGRLTDNFYMNPVSKITIDNVKQLRTRVPKHVMSEDKWVDYISNKLLPEIEVYKITEVLSYVQ